VLGITFGSKRLLFFCITAVVSTEYTGILATAQILVFSAHSIFPRVKVSTLVFSAQCPNFQNIKVFGVLTPRKIYFAIFFSMTRYLTETGLGEFEKYTVNGRLVVTQCVCVCVCLYIYIYIQPFKNYWSRDAPTV